jgi:hypothetical protein
MIPTSHDKSKLRNFVFHWTTVVASEKMVPKRPVSRWIKVFSA